MDAAGTQNQQHVAAEGGATDKCCDEDEPAAQHSFSVASAERPKQRKSVCWLRCVIRHCGDENDMNVVCLERARRGAPPPPYSQGRHLLLSLDRIWTRWGPGYVEWGMLLSYGMVWMQVRSDGW